MGIPIIGFGSTNLRVRMVQNAQVRGVRPVSANGPAVHRPPYSGGIGVDIDRTELVFSPIES